MVNGQWSIVDGRYRTDETMDVIGLMLDLWRLMIDDCWSKFNDWGFVIEDWRFRIKAWLLVTNDWRLTELLIIFFVQRAVLQVVFTAQVQCSVSGVPVTRTKNKLPGCCATNVRWTPSRPPTVPTTKQSAYVSSIAIFTGPLPRRGIPRKISRGWVVMKI